MKVHELMTRDVITIAPDSSLKEAARGMIGAGVSGLVVADGEGDLKGVITEADFVKTESDRRAKKRARLLRWFGGPTTEVPSTERLVSDVMTTEVVTVGPEADHAEAARMMRSAGVKRLPVVDNEGRLVGILSRSDIMRAFVRSDEDIVAEITEHVLGKVLWIDRRRVDVTSVDGNVSLKGQLETRSDATLLEDLSRRVDGVVSVNSELTWEVDNTKLEMVSPPPTGTGRPTW